MHLCEEDRILSSISSQLLDNSEVDFDRWYQQFLESKTGMAGSANLEFPPQPSKRLSLMYQLLFRINQDEIDLISFCSDAFATGSSKLRHYVNEFNQAIVHPLVKEFNFKLDEINERLVPQSDRSLISPQVLRIINTGDHAEQNVQIGSSNVQEVAGSDTNLDELLEDLRSQLKQASLSEPQETSALEILDSLEEELAKEDPSPNVVGALLNRLPTVANVASIAASILSMVG